MDAAIDTRAKAVRSFNRFHTQQIGVLRECVARSRSPKSGCCSSAIVATRFVLEQTTPVSLAMLLRLNAGGRG